MNDLTSAELFEYAYRDALTRRTGVAQSVSLDAEALGEVLTGWLNSERVVAMERRLQSLARRLAVRFEETNRLREALHELVDLKRGDDRGGDYQRRKALAWQAAFAVIDDLDSDEC